MDPDVIKDALVKRAQEIEDLTSNFERTDDPKHVAPKEETHELDQEENGEDEELKGEGSYDGEIKDPKKSLAYSFFNNLGVYGQDYLQYLNYTISNVDDEANEKITWETLVSRLSDKSLGTDLFNLPYEFFSERKLKDVISEYVRFKNNLLFSTIEDSIERPDSIFGLPYEEKETVLKRVETSEENQLYSHGAVINVIGVKNPMYVIGKYIEVNGKKVFVSLAVAPDLYNPNVIAGLDSITLGKMYYEVDDSPNKEILINPKAISIYKGVQVPKTPNGETKINPISVDEIADTFPGATVSEIRVFRDDVDYIRSQFKLYETSEVTEDKRNYNNYRFRPYVIVSFSEGGVKFQKLVVLQGKSRSLNTMWSELNTALDNKEEASHIVSKYRGWEIMFEFIKSLETQEDRDGIVDHISNYFSAVHGSKVESWETFRDVLAKMAQVDPNSRTTFKDFINENDGKIKSIITNMKETQDLKIGNPMYLLHSLFKTSQYKINNWENFLNEKGDSIQVYYNTVIKSTNTTEAGGKYGLFTDVQKPFYTMNYAVESNKLLFDLDNIKAMSSKKVTPEVKVEKVEAKKSILKTLMIKNDDGLSTQVTVSQNENDSPDILINLGNTPLEEQQLLLDRMDKCAKESIQKDYFFEEEGKLFRETDDGEEPMDIYLKKLYNSEYYLRKESGGSIEYFPKESWMAQEADTNKQTQCNIN